MTQPALATRLARHIRAHGPMTVAAFMAVALHDPEAGYYANRQPLGAAGDFVTAPEVSQIFGEIVGASCAECWARMGRPAPVVLAELGPGRGTLMSDLLRAAATAPGFRAAVRLALVEASPILRREQHQRLAEFNPTWVDTLDDVPDGPLLLVANEFLDALPIRQLVRGRAGWAERMVAADEAGRLCLVDGAEGQALSLLVPEARRDAAAGAIVELCPAATTLAAVLAERLVRQPGAAWFIDYGYADGSPGATLAAVGQHRAAGILESPGDADLSAHVDFAAFAEAARTAGAAVHGPVTQRDFLLRLGAAERHALLRHRATPAQRAGLDAGYRRLIDPEEMGTLFKVLAVTSPNLPPPEGFGDGATTARG